MSKVNLPLTVSAKSANLKPGDEPIRINPYANMGITSESAPVLLALESVKTVGAEEFAVKMIRSGGQGTLAQARLALNATLTVLEGLVDEYGAVTVQTPMGTIETFIAGTLENPQDQPDPEKNYAFLGIVVPECYRRLFAEVETYVPAEVCSVTLKRVRDKATNVSGICGTGPFYLEGYRMSIGGEGETLELLDPVTHDKLCDISVAAEPKSTVQFVCTLVPSTRLEAGTYLLRLTTLAGGEPGATLWPVELKVELLEGTPGKRVSITTFEASEKAEECELAVTGENLDGVKGYAEEESGERHFDGKAYSDGGAAEEVVFYRNDETGEYRCRIPNPGEGKTVRVVLEPDPAKPEFDPTPAEAEAIVG